ncbi:2'-5' RNA ligase family protein [Altererythrobacter lutimaris]|uniref:2'-5' RNA ligase family protein n=1 Tax=Altererythrobacter lutimaris TaxID=2743979 RepID=A0A850HCL2_9SPHN|nr:2'-5' RNA ligase family protein [Altererythrobacter lutimaris]NVE94378.1 2'-5' RNA ligase family protein [Altererythrobacter lutimaris]
MANPFIVTAKLPPDIQGWAEGLRRTHYPPERNHLHAHVTMFHSFAPSLLEEVKDYLPRIAGEFAAPAAEIKGVMDLGKGTAIALEAPQLLTLRDMIADHFHGSLTAQDLYEPRPHITIQNKVTKEKARALQAQLVSELEPRSFTFPALELHLYQGGPWDLVKASSFRGNEAL